MNRLRVAAALVIAINAVAAEGSITGRHAAVAAPAAAQPSANGVRPPVPVVRDGVEVATGSRGSGMVGTASLLLLSLTIGSAAAVAALARRRRGPA